MNDKILLVDDESRVLDGIKRGLHGQYDIVVADGGEVGIQKLEEDSAISVVVSDMRMPRMDGAQFLAQVRKDYPHVVRIMLTGNNDQETAKRAVNDGAIFRFLNKPCTRDGLKEALDSALEHVRGLRVENELLEKTLGASVTVMADILAIMKPQYFGLTGAVTKKCAQLAKQVGGVEPWTMHAAASLSTLGYVGVEDEIIEKRRGGTELTRAERTAYNEHANVGASLIEKIPRMDQVAGIVRHQNTSFSSTASPVPPGAHILHVVAEFELLRNGGWSPEAIVEKLRKQQGEFDPRVMVALIELLKNEESSGTVKRVDVRKLDLGMVIQEDVVTTSDVLIVCKGQPVTAAVAKHLQKLAARGTLTMQPLVMIPRDENMPEPAVA